MGADGSLKKQILSAASKKRRCARDLLGEMPMPSGSSTEPPHVTALLQEFWKLPDLDSNQD